MRQEAVLQRCVAEMQRNRGAVTDSRGNFHSRLLYRPFCCEYTTVAGNNRLAVVRFVGIFNWTLNTKKEIKHGGVVMRGQLQG